MACISEKSRGIHILLSQKKKGSPASSVGDTSGFRDTSKHWDRYILTLSSVALFNQSDPRGVISMTLPLKTVRCLQLAWGNSRSKPITPSTSTETCEYWLLDLTVQCVMNCECRLLVTSDICVFKVLWGWCVLCVPLGPGSWLRWSYSHQEGRGWIQEDQRVLGLHPRGGGAGENQLKWNGLTFAQSFGFLFDLGFIHNGNTKPLDTEVRLTRISLEIHYLSAKTNHNDSIE